MSIDFKNVYGDRILEINKQIRAALKNKKYVDAAKLEAEKADIEKKIKQIEELKHEKR